MSTDSQSHLLDEAIVESLDVSPRRLSKFTLFWYLKSLPEHSFGTILGLIPIVVGAVLALGLLVDWAIHRSVSNADINTALNYDLDKIDRVQIRTWLKSPGFTSWVRGVETWAILVPLLLLAVLIVGWFVIRTLQWRRIRFGIEDGVIWMSGGLFTPWTRRLPITHVQSVEVRSTVLQRLMTLRAVSISSGAAEGKHATIELLAVRRGVAAELTNTLDTAFGVKIASPDGTDAGSETIASVSWKQLLVAAANSFEIRLSIVSLYFIYHILGQGAIKAWRDRVIGSVTGYAEQHHNLWNLLLLGIGAVIFFWVFSIFSFILTFARFRLRRSGRLALLEHGLLTRRWRTVLLPHVQALTFVESPAQQLTGAGSLRMTLPGTTRGQLERTMLLPSVPGAHAFSVLDRLFAELAPGTGSVLQQLERDLQHVPTSARRSYLLSWLYRLLPLSGLLCLVLYLVPGGVNALWGLAPLVILGPIGMLLGNARFKDAGWALDDAGRFAVRSRGFSRITRVAPSSRIVWSRISGFRSLTGANVTFLASVAGAGSRPGIKARLMGYGLVAPSNGRFQVIGMPRDAALDLVEQLRPAVGSHSDS